MRLLLFLLVAIDPVSQAYQQELKQIHFGIIWIGLVAGPAFPW
jgi:hypothetical protein